jgi:short-subunit dehydrogenase
MNRTAVITGAASGIGRALSVALAKTATLALVDLDGEGLLETQRLVAEAGGRASTHVVDVSDESAVHAFTNNVISTYGAIDILVNNAGVALFGTIAEVQTDEMAWLMNINFWGTVYMTKAFLSTLVARPKANIVNISSVFGLYGPPGQSAYASSKFAVKGFTESLRGELAGTNVCVTTVHPGGIRTNIAKGSRIARNADHAKAERMTKLFNDQFLTTPPEVVANGIVRAIEMGQTRLVIGSGAAGIDWLTRLFPSRAAAMIAKRSAPKR